MGEITVPVGFIWDGCSTPRAIWGLVPRWGAYSGAALIHDWLYHQHLGHRSDADRILLELLIEDRVPPDQAMMMHRAVRLFGGDYWNVSA
jgi:hypothetical protein